MKPRKLEHAQLLTWEKDRFARPFEEWQIWQVPCPAGYGANYALDRMVSARPYAKA